MNSNKLGIFGFNEPKGNIDEYNILENIKQLKERKTIIKFTLKMKNDVFYILLENKYLLLC